MASPRILTTDCDLYRISPSAPKSCLVCVGNETITVSRQSYFISPLRPHPQDRILYHVAQDGLKLITSFELLIFLSLSAECWELQVCPLACFIYLFRDQMVPCQYPTYWETRMSQPPPAHTRHHHPRRTKRRRVPHLQKPSVHRKLRHWPGRWLLVSQGHLGCAGGQHATTPH